MIAVRADSVGTLRFAHATRLIAGLPAALETAPALPAL